MKKRFVFALLALLTSLWPLSAKEKVTDSLGNTTFNLDQIVVTGLRSPRLLKDTPVQTRLISAQEIKRVDATDIQDLFTQELPGVEFSYAMNQQTHLNFNGQGGQSVLFLVDGERLAGETMDNIDFSRLDMANVERIEIVKGASSALYGSNAGGGVINIITRRLSEPWRVSTDAKIAKHNDQRYNLSLSGGKGIFRNILAGHHHSIDNYDVHSAPNPITRLITTIYGSKVWNLSDRFTIQPLDNLKFTGRAAYFFRQLSRNADNPERYRDYSAGLKGEWSPTALDRISLSYAFDQYDKSDFYRITNLDIRNYSNVQNSVRGLYNHTFQWGDVFTAGADFMHDFLRNNRLADPKRSQSSADVFAQYDRIFSDQWELVGALRYDYFSDGRDSRLTPKLTARFRPINNLNLRLGYGMGFRAPTLKEKYYQFDMAGIWIVNGNPDLKPESSHNITFSAEYTKRKYNFTFSAYYNNIHNRISTGVPYYRPDGDTQLYLDYVNLRHFSVAGGEISARAAWDCGLSAKISYAYTNEHLAKGKDGNTINNQYIPARKHSFTARIDWDKRFSNLYSLSLSFSGRALSSVKNIEYKDYYDISAGTVTVNYPAYSIWKLSASQNFGKNIRLTLAADNIFNYKPRHYYLNCPLTDGINLSAGLSIDLYAGNK